MSDHHAHATARFPREHDDCDLTLLQALANLLASVDADGLLTHEALRVAPDTRVGAIRELADEGLAPSAIGITWHDRSAEVAILGLDPSDPVGQVAQVACPVEWDAFGVVTRGTATTLRPDEDVHERVQVAVLVDRLGRIASAVRTLDGGVLCDGIIDLAEGRVPDACRRVLGLPTAPPPAEPFALLALLWADGVAALGAAHPGQVSWGDILATRPFDPRSTWTELRLGVASGALQVPGITSDLAAFMDDGMFAREAVAGCPSPRALFEVLSATVDREVLGELVEHLDEVADRLGLG